MIKIVVRETGEFLGYFPNLVVADNWHDAWQDSFPFDSDGMSAAPSCDFIQEIECKNCNTVVPCGYFCDQCGTAMIHDARQKMNRRV